MRAILGQHEAYVSRRIVLAWSVKNDWRARTLPRLELEPVPLLKGTARRIVVVDELIENRIIDVFGGYLVTRGATMHPPVGESMRRQRDDEKQSGQHGVEGNEQSCCEKEWVGDDGAGWGCIGIIYSVLSESCWPRNNSTAYE